MRGVKTRKKSGRQAIIADKLDKISTEDMNKAREDHINNTYKRYKDLVPQYFKKAEQRQMKESEMFGLPSKTKAKIKIKMPEIKIDKKQSKSIALKEMIKNKKSQLSETINQESLNLNKIDDSIIDSRYSILTDNDPELGKLYEKFKTDNIDIKDDLALFRAVFVKAAGSESSLSLDKVLHCLEKITQITERSSKVEKSMNSEVDKIVNVVVDSIDKVLDRCPHCNLSLFALKENIAKEIRNIGKNRK